MTLVRRIGMLLIGVVVLTLAACGGVVTAPVEDVDSAPVEDAPPPTEAAVPTQGNAVVPSEDVEELPPLEESSGQVTLITSQDGRTYPPTRAAAIDEDFRSDPAEAIGATGRVQLVEFFAFW